MSGIFISYRREDSAGWTGRLSEQLKSRFGSKYIFMDIDTIAPGVDFTDALQKAVSSCNVLLAIIGPKWATAADKSGKLRIEDPNDWVRVEIAAALKRNIPVIPVLVGGATIPTMDLLPDELDPLAHRQAHEVTDKRWSYDLDQLMHALPPPPRPFALWHNNLLSSKPVVLGALVIAMLIGAQFFVLPVENTAPARPIDILETPVVSTSVAPPSSVQTLVQSIPSTTPHMMRFRVGEEVRLKDSRTSWMYKVLAIQIDRSWKNTLSLHLAVRATNEGALTAGFGNNNFSLLVDDNQRAPTSNLHESIDPHSAKEGVVAFTVPTNAQRLILQLRVGSEVAEMPIDVTHPSPLPATTLSPRQTAHLDKVRFPIELRTGQETHLKDHRATCVYKVVAAQLTRARQDALLLRVTVSVASEGPLTTDLDDQNFRLLIDDVPRAPITHLHDSVDPHRVKEGTVEFDVPATAKQIVLQLRLEDQAAEFPLDLSPLWS